MKRAIIRVEPLPTFPSFVRDDGMFDRREVPQYEPDAQCTRA
jgi:hypothetical protein